MTSRTFRKLLSVIFLASVFLGCQDEEETILPPQEPEVADKDTVSIVEAPKVMYNLQGTVQKGPFINGTAITVSELNQKLVATGKNFTTQIIDNKGSFSLKDVKLQSDFVQLIAEGFYFDEVRGEKSAAQLTLFALADVSDASSVNVNLLSHLEKDRVIYLMQEEEKSFAVAKQQAQREILAIFGIEKADMMASELLDISQDGDDNAILLAISAILQGNNSVAELSELLANLITDIRKDGALDSESTREKIRANAMALRLTDIRQHLEVRYEELGVNATIPNFEQYIVTNPEYENPLTVKTRFPVMDHFDKVSFAIDGYIYAGSIVDEDLAPREETRKFFKYDPSLDNWTPIADFPGEPRSGAASFVVGNKAYVGLGQNNEKGRLNDFWTFDPEQNKWANSAVFPGKSALLTAAFVLDNKAYLRFEKESWQFDASLNTWNKTEVLKGATPYNTFSFNINGKGYIGNVQAPDSDDSGFWEYESDSGQWTERAILPHHDIEQTIGFSTTNKGYVFASSFSSKIIYEYNPLRNNWSTIELRGFINISPVINRVVSTPENAYLLDYDNHFYEFTPPQE
jgi:hypothetical protein